VPDGFQIPVAVNLVGFQITSLGPFVPTVDVHDAWTFRIGKEPVFHGLQGLFEIRRTIVDQHTRIGIAQVMLPLRLLVSSGARIPAHRHIREIRHTIICNCLIPVFQVLAEDDAVIGFALV